MNRADNLALLTTGIDSRLTSGDICQTLGCLREWSVLVSSSWIFGRVYFVRKPGKLTFRNSPSVFWLYSWSGQGRKLYVKNFARCSGNGPPLLTLIMVCIVIYAVVARL